jgi:RimJ/RimL family protein N-acetyltransferase
MKDIHLPKLTSSRLCLRPLTEADTDSIYSIFSNPEVMRYWSFPPLPDRQACENLIGTIIKDVASGSMMKWGVALADNDVVIGTTTLFQVNLDQGRAEVGYALARDYWGQGYMNEALQSLLEYAFSILNLRRLEADVDPRNAGSIRTLERLGFQREGFLRERWHVAGEIQDAYFYGLLKREWLKS